MGIAITAGAVVLVVVILALASYHVAPTDTVLVITGMGKRKFVTGGSVFIIPFIQRVDRLPLGAIQSELVTKEPIPTHDAILVQVKAVANFQIGTNEQLQEIAARNYLNQKRDAMTEDVTQVLMGKIRETIGTMNLIDLMQNREKFNEAVTRVSSEDMNNLGLDLVTFNIQDFTDNEGIIKAMGANQSAEIQRDAQLARINAEQKVAERDNELLLKKAALKKESDRAKAEADLVYDTEKAVRTKELNIAQQDAEIAAEERKIELTKKQADVREGQLNADVKKKADADRYAAEQKADADLYISKQSAEAVKLNAAADAESTKIRGQAEGESIKAKGQGEAAGLEAQGKAYNSMENPLILAQKYVEQLPDMIRAAAEPLNKVDRITMYGEGNQAKLVGDTTKTVAQISDSMKDTLGFDLGSVVQGFITGKTINTVAKPATSEPEVEEAETATKAKSTTSKK